MPDVSSIAPAGVDQWIVFDVHEHSLVAGVPAPDGGAPEVTRLEHTERAVRGFIHRLGRPEGSAVAGEAGPCGYDPRPYLPRDQEEVERGQTGLAFAPASRDPLAQRALEHMLAHLDAVDSQLAAIDHELETEYSSGDQQHRGHIAKTASISEVPRHLDGVFGR